MKNIWYQTTHFHKAVKRNLHNIDYVTCNDFTDEFYFVTQKAVINYACPSGKYREIMEEWLKKNGVKIKYVY